MFDPVEGADDQKFLEILGWKFCDARKIESGFNDKNIGIEICGGDNLQHYVDKMTFKKINRKYGVLIDSEKRLSITQLRRTSRIGKQPVNMMEEYSI